jgi:hypothetical protein
MGKGKRKKRAYNNSRVCAQDGMESGDIRTLSGWLSQESLIVRGKDKRVAETASSSNWITKSEHLFVSTRPR